MVLFSIFALALHTVLLFHQLPWPWKYSKHMISTSLIALHLLTGIVYSLEILGIFTRAYGDYWRLMMTQRVSVIKQG
ncbi:hypothetical protein Pint_24046 [Pistacia integerrima]|uniref:Uncharacterized protein n=1 Tax=Pistacia integerrima TaxID=434235 RepID=A0ACC0YP80_9ROSI|nr:hypothetical protein Pint_24046 [Pistacia integerrima]